MDKPKQIFITVDSDYLAACARIRNVSLTGLVHRLIHVIDRDHLVLAILDDEDHYREKERYKHSFRV